MNERALSRDEARDRKALVRDVAYDIQLDVVEAADTFLSTTTVTFGAADGARSTFLDLSATDVEEVTLNGRPVSDAFAEGRVRLDGLADQNEVVVRARCAYSRAGVGLHRFIDPVDDETFLYTQFEPNDAHRVFACFDQPDLKASFTLHVTAPAGWTVVSNSPVAAQPDEGEAGVWSFEPTPPISTYLAAVVAGPYASFTDQHGDIPLAIYCRRSMAQHMDPDEVFELTKQGLDHFTTLFGRDYPFAKYDQLFVPEFNFGAMENPGCVTFSEKYIFRSRVTQAARMSRANTILHEMAHMWFGDLVTMRWWDDLWLNESFATFTAYEAVCDATRFGRDSWADFAASFKNWAYREDQQPGTHPIVADVPTTDDVLANFDGITYAKGASVLRQLNAWVGPEAFRKGVRSHFDTHAWGNAELTDFLSALEAPSGRDLRPWAARWLQTAGVNTLRAEVESAVPDGGGDELLTRVVIHQETPDEHPTLRPHRLGVGLYDLREGQLVRRELVEVDVDGAATELPGLVGRPRPDVVLVNDEDLAYAKIRFDDRSLDALIRSLGTIDDGVARVVCWSALWDATRDAELAARRFLDLACAQGAAEPDVGVLQTLMNQALACATRYGDPANREAALDRIAATSSAAIARSEPGSDRQLVWVRSLIRSRRDQARITDMLAGREVPEGLAVDTDLRWFALTNLAATGDADETAIAAELERDNTDVGQRHAVTARAARPDADAKAEAWEIALDRSKPMHTRRAALSGLWQIGQEDLLADLVASGWAQALPTLWAEAPGEEALAMTRVLYPHDIVSEELLATAGEVLAMDLPSSALRAVSEGREGTERALRTRAVDAAEG